MIKSNKKKEGWKKSGKKFCLFPGALRFKKIWSENFFVTRRKSRKSRKKFTPFSLKIPLFSRGILHPWPRFFGHFSHPGQKKFPQKLGLKFWSWRLEAWEGVDNLWDWMLDFCFPKTLKFCQFLLEKGFW